MSFLQNFTLSASSCVISCPTNKIILSLLGLDKPVTIYHPVINSSDKLSGRYRPRHICITATLIRYAVKLQRFLMPQLFRVDNNDIGMLSCLVYVIHCYNSAQDNRKTNRLILKLHGRAGIEWK